MFTRSITTGAIKRTVSIGAEPKTLDGVSPPMSPFTKNSSPDDKPRLVVVVPVILVCLGAIFLLFNAIGPVRNEPSRGQTNGVSEAPAAMMRAPRGPLNQKHAPDSKTISRPPSRLLPRQRTDAPPEAVPAETADLQPQTAATASEPGLAQAGGALLSAAHIEISGKVTLTGTPPPEINIDMSGDARCGRLHKTPVTTRHYLVDKDGGLANVFVYVKSGLNRKWAAPTQEPVLDQIGCLYEPYVMGLMVNQKFQIRNSDPTLHNVHATPQQGDNHEFNFAQLSNGQVNERSFPSPEIFVRFKCDVHPWMFAYVGVVEHPFFAVTGADGTFRLPPDLPPGTYGLEAVHPKAGTAMQEITVTGSDRKTVDF